MSLYYLQNEYTRLAAAYEYAESDEERELISHEIENLDIELSARAEYCARLWKNLCAEADSVAVEIKRLQEVKKRKEKTAYLIRHELQSAMTAANVRRVETPIGRWSMRKNPPSVVVTDEKCIPDEYLIPQPPKVDAMAIKKHFSETGEIIPGVDIQLNEGVQLR